MNYKYITILFSISIIVLTAYLSIILDENKNEEINSFNSQSIDMTYTSYMSIFNTFKATAQVHNLRIAKDKKVLKILRDFKYAKTQDEKQITRGKLYRELFDEYSYLKKIGIRQFHFHTHKGESLLRFHKPYLNGDSLIEIRESIAIANTKFENFYGFEGGRIFPGFRYVFPIFDGKEHLGSVEFSLPFDVIEKELNIVLPKIAYQLHLSKEISYEKVLKDSRNFFKESPILNDHYIENINISKIEEKIINNKLISMFYNNIDKNQLNSEDKSNFSVYFLNNHKAYRADFISIKQTQNSHGAYLVAYTEFNELLNIKERYKDFKVLLFLACFIILILAHIIYYQLDNIDLQKRNLEKILDYQKNIVIHTKNGTIIYANKSFYRFTGYKSIKDFLKKYNCICDLFVENDKFFYVKEDSLETNWIEKIQSLPKHKQVVGLLGPNFEVHGFSVRVSKYIDGSYILTFFDISDTLKQQIKLEQKSFHDSLTNALNREYFQENNKYIIKQFNEDSNKLALALLDIDHFKKVNDTFGHDVGDSVLIEFVRVIEKFSRDDDILIRWGGEEFILLLKVKSKEDLEKALEHIRKVIKLNDFTTVEKITCSIGGTIYKDNENIKDTIKRADEALYEAKASGRNKVIININGGENYD